MSDVPEPLVPPSCDCRDLDGFMLNVERLMASELVALSTHEVVAAALFLWCRAWKQIPAASLPDDDKVLASFARLPLARFKKIKAAVLRGFVKCTDSRLYHRVLAKEAIGAYQRKVDFQRKRATDSERLRRWRAKSETRFNQRFETQNETHFVPEGQGQGQYKNPADAGLPKEDLLPADDQCQFPSPAIKQESRKPELNGEAKEKRDLYRRGEEILGSRSGSLVTKLLQSQDGNVALARAVIERASAAHDPRSYIGKTLKGDGNATRSLRERGEAW
jgi:uncharacterized protein YdaU (DUF1376 family)